ncbi:MAG: PaaI family thioesterase [Alphaproteobacteria bacterium]|nr:PaaI family thioesterase [Alphaproteobacteria bacterium]
MSDMAESWRLAMMAGMGRTPFANALGGTIESVTPGRVRMRLPYSKKLIGNPDTGVVHGGVITGFLDQSCGMAVGSTLKSPRGFATLDLRIDYMKPARLDADLIFDGECIRIAHEVAFARARAFQDSLEDPVAIATATFMFTEMAVSSAPER